MREEDQEQSAADTLLRVGAAEPPKETVEQVTAEAMLRVVADESLTLMHGATKGRPRAEHRGGVVGLTVAVEAPSVEAGEVAPVRQNRSKERENQSKERDRDKPKERCVPVTVAPQPAPEEEETITSASAYTHADRS